MEEYQVQNHCYVDIKESNTEWRKTLNQDFGVA